MGLVRLLMRGPIATHTISDFDSAYNVIYVFYVFCLYNCILTLRLISTPQSLLQAIFLLFPFLSCSVVVCMCVCAGLYFIRYVQARRQETKWGWGVFFVKKWTFPHKMKRNWIKLCVVIYDSDQLFTVNDLHS